jgi:heme A synthase
VGSSVRESLWLFPAIETVHLLGMAALVGTITVFDLRLLGWMMRRERVSELARRLLPWTWLGFALQVVTGIALFLSEAAKVYSNPAFRLKIVLILLAGLHALIFHKIVYRDVATWDEGEVLPMGA